AAAARLLQRQRGGFIAGEDHVGLEGCELDGCHAQALGTAARPAFDELDVPALHPPEVLQLALECRYAQLALGVLFCESSQQHADAPHGPGLLRTRRERPRGCHAAKDEPSPPQIEHQAALALASPLVSLPHRQPAAESPTSPWGSPELS